MSTAAPSTDPVQASSGKKKNNKKKKNANKPKDPVDTGNGGGPPGNDGEGGDDDEPETPSQAAPTKDATAHPTTESEPKANGTGAGGSDENTEVARLKSELEEAVSAKEQAEEAYEGLLERVNHLKTTLGDRLKRDRAELEEAKERIEELEAQNEQLQTSSRDSDSEVAKLKEELQESSREATSLRSRSNLSQQNWTKERDEMARLVSNLKEEVETTTNAMGEWEVIAMEERSVKESLVDKASELEDQVAALRDNYQAAAAERDGQSKAVDSLQNALGEIQEARKRELREMVESSEEQVQALKRLVQEADRRALEAEAAKDNLTKELERTAPFEKEVKEKNLLIGKLRHEAIVLNDHLTKALRYLKKTKPEDNVDRQIVTNHMLHFLTLDRSDPKRFQILQVMAGYLDWNDEQREQAGLARPGASTAGGGGGGSGSTLRLPTSPFHRTPSTPSLSAGFFADASGGGSGGGGRSASSSGANKETLADLWTGFLERQAQEGVTSPEVESVGGAGDRGGERKGSTASSGAPWPETRGG